MTIEQIWKTNDTSISEIVKMIKEKVQKGEDINSFVELLEEEINKCEDIEMLNSIMYDLINLWLTYDRAISVAIKIWERIIDLQIKDITDTNSSRVLEIVK